MKKKEDIWQLPDTFMDLPIPEMVATEGAMILRKVDQGRSHYVNRLCPICGAAMATYIIPVMWLCPNCLWTERTYEKGRPSKLPNNEILWELFDRRPLYGLDEQQTQWAEQLKKASESDKDAEKA